MYASVYAPEYEESYRAAGVGVEKRGSCEEGAAMENPTVDSAVCARAPSTFADPRRLIFTLYRSRIMQILKCLGNRRRKLSVGRKLVQRYGGNDFSRYGKQIQRGNISPLQDAIAFVSRETQKCRFYLVHVELTTVLRSYVSSSDRFECSTRIYGAQFLRHVCRIVPCHVISYHTHTHMYIYTYVYKANIFKAS